MTRFSSLNKRKKSEELLKEAQELRRLHIEEGMPILHIAKKINKSYYYVWQRVHLKLKNLQDLIKTSSDGEEVKVANEVSEVNENERKDFKEAN